MDTMPAPQCVGPGTAVPATIPATAGIGLRAIHYQDILKQRPALGWLEVHPENYFAPGGKHHYYLERLREYYPLSLHGVGLSLGSTDALNTAHLDQLKALIDRYDPGLVSEHISWGSVGERYMNDLLPLPYTESALAHLVNRVSQVQDYLGRQILVENVSSYLEYTISTIPEWEFADELCRRSGCGLLLDVNNIYVNAHNHGFAPEVFIDYIHSPYIQEIHLAGFSVNRIADREIFIDTHNRAVCEPVWTLYESAIRRFGPLPTLIEWDADLPPLATLLSHAERAGRIIGTQHAFTA